MSATLSVRLIPIREVPKFVPSRSPGKKVSIATVYRWAERGLLETVKVAGGRFTTIEAVEKFLSGQAERTGMPPPFQPVARRHPGNAAEELKKMGI